ncbi:MAG: ImmA/IrrE family metallo-endopeptidase, partial [Propionibacteriaceae bacterium]|nr:ImmA/IrrE family metallo-endopeptidase [Propionibacteriaceae bacterium]
MPLSPQTEAARRLLDELGFDTTRPVDPFDAIARLGLVLVFKPLDDVLGVTLPGRPGGPAGILLNQNRPVPIQRLTAAHEIGHWVLHHGLLTGEPAGWIADHSIEVMGQADRDTEREARRFARAFLMPAELVAAAVARYAPAGEPLSAEDVYRLARDVGAPYSDACRRLRDEGLVGPADYVRLRDARPSEIKRRLTGGEPAPPGSEVWVIDETAAADLRTGAEPREPAAVGVDVAVGDQLLAALPESAGTGYRWVDAATLAARPAAQAPPPFGGGAKLAWPPEPAAPLAAPRPAAAAPTVLAVAEDSAAPAVLALSDDSTAPDDSAGEPRLGGVVKRRLRFDT